MNRLKEARFFANNMPQIRLWLLSGVHYSTISRIESGYLQPSKKQKEKLASALGKEIDWLFPQD